MPSRDPDLFRGLRALGDLSWQATGALLKLAVVLGGIEALFFAVSWLLSAGWHAGVR